jgi:ABC-2 type transport system ATP-binding protein
VIQVTNLTKRYERLTALDRFTLHVPAGAIFGLLGPNGAGKTTLIRLLVGLIFPDGGTIQLSGVAPYQVGYLPERPHFAPRFRVKEYLRLVGEAGGLSGRALAYGVNRALQLTGMQIAAGKRVADCSKGMLQRLGLAQALLADPPLILLDEPFSGLDPTAQVSMRTVIQRLNQAGTTIVLSTHRLSDVNQVCTDIAILADGRLAHSGPLTEVLAPRSQVLIRTAAPLPEPLATQLQQALPEFFLAADGKEITLPDSAMQAKAVVLQALLKSGVEVTHLEQQRATLEEVYLEAIRP